MPSKEGSAANNISLDDCDVEKQLEEESQQTTNFWLTEDQFGSLMALL